MDAEKYWSRVKLLIKRRNTTQREFAKACGISYKTLCGWSYRNILPPLFDGYIIARTLGVSIEYLIEGKDELSKRSLAKIKKAHILLQQVDKSLDRII
jgi:transcriptional regulator with XRE-family HTH domain